MARDEHPPFARGATFYGGSPIDTLNLGGPNIEGKEYLFEPNAENDPVKADTSGRPIWVKVVRNVSPVNLKPARIAHYASATTGTPLYETQVDGYCIAAASRPAGVIDEFLPPAGVPPNDLFFLVIEGPSQVVQGATTAATLLPESVLVPAAYGATVGDDLGGRVTLQDLTGAAAVLGVQLQNKIGRAGISNNTAGARVACVVRLRR